MSQSVILFLDGNCVGNSQLNELEFGDLPRCSSSHFGWLCDKIVTPVMSLVEIER